MSNNAAAQFTPPSLLLTTIGLSLATFMQVLDTTIANVALPTISGNLGVSYEQGTWVITSFAVSNAIALPLTGWLSRRFGEVKLFIWATLLFVLASFLCGIAQSMPELVGFRVLQGVVAGPLYPMTQTLLIAVYPPAKRGWRWPCWRWSRWWRRLPGRFWGLDYRQLQLAVDLLHQRTHRLVRRRRRAPADAYAACGHQPPADGLHRSAHVDHRCRRVAGGAGQRQ